MIWKLIRYVLYQFFKAKGHTMTQRMDFQNTKMRWGGGGGGGYIQDTCRTVLGERKMVLHVHEYDFGISQSATILIQPKACLAE
jgi:hypothetical protein